MPRVNPAVTRTSSRPDALAKPKYLLRIHRSLDALEPRVVRPVVRVLPVRELGVDVVLVRVSGDVRTHRRVEALDPRVSLRRLARAVVGEVLQRAEHRA